MAAAPQPREWALTLSRWTVPFLTGVTLVFACAERGTAIADWHYVVQGAHLLSTRPPWELYGRAPDIQMGPLTLALGWLLISVFGATAQLVWGAVAVASLPVLLQRLTRRLDCAYNSTHPSVLLVGGLVVAPFWAQLIVTGHLDDWLVLVLLVEAMPLTFRLPGFLTLAAAAKPSALLALPVLLHRPRKIRTLTILGLASCLIWLPFLWSAPFEAGRVRFYVDPTSAVHLFGLTGVAPLWVRPAQLVLSVIVGAIAGRRGGPSAALAAAAAVRFAVDPGAWAYFLATVVFLALVHDICRGSNKPTVTYLAAATAVSILNLPSAVAGDLRLVTCVALVVTIVRMGPPRDSANREQPPQSAALDIPAPLPFHP